MKALTLFVILFMCFVAQQSIFSQEKFDYNLNYNRVWSVGDTVWANHGDRIFGYLDKNLYLIPGSSISLLNLQRAVIISKRKNGDRYEYSVEFVRKKADFTSLLLRSCYGDYLRVMTARPAQNLAIINW